MVPDSDHTVLRGRIPDDQQGAGSRGSLSEALATAPEWSDSMVAEHGIPVTDVPLVSVGGGLGSLALVDTLRIFGAGTDRIKVLTDLKHPYDTYRYLASNSQIPDHERLRSDAGSVMDNIWGFPSYALREAWDDKSIRAAWTVLTEPVLSEWFTPRAGQVYTSVDRETARIGWESMVSRGYVRTARKRTGGGYFVLQTPADASMGAPRIAFRTQFVHFAVGYSAVRILDDLQEYRQAYDDYQRVVNAYEPHEHVYDEALRRPVTVVVRGSGIVASRILQRLLDDREKHGAQTQVLHVFRHYVSSPQGTSATFRRPGSLGFAYQGFNFSKSAWGGQHRDQIRRLEGDERARFVDSIGGTNTPYRSVWIDQMQRGIAGGWYRQAVGEVEQVTPSADGRSLVTVLKQADGNVFQIPSEFIIDATGLEADVAEHRVLSDLLAYCGAGRNPKGRLDVERTFEIRGTRSGQGRMYASGTTTLGGYFAPNDSFLGLQYAAMEIADDLASQGFVRRLGPLRSAGEWWRWARNRPPKAQAMSYLPQGVASALGSAPAAPAAPPSPAALAALSPAPAAADPVPAGTVTGDANPTLLPGRSSLQHPPSPAAPATPGGPPAGWYPQADGTRRYWDGTAWGVTEEEYRRNAGSS